MKRTIIEDIAALRFNKINIILESVKPEGLVINFNNITSRELEMIRPFANDALTMKLEMFNCSLNPTENENNERNSSYNLSNSRISQNINPNYR